MFLYEDCTVNFSKIMMFHDFPETTTVPQVLIAHPLMRGNGRTLSARESQ